MCAHVFCVETRNCGNTSGTWFSDVDQRGGLRRETWDIFLVVLRSVSYANCNNHHIYWNIRASEETSALSQPIRTDPLPPDHHIIALRIYMKCSRLPEWFSSVLKFQSRSRQIHDYSNWFGRNTRTKTRWILYQESLLLVLYHGYHQLMGVVAVTGCLLNEEHYQRCVIQRTP